MPVFFAPLCLCVFVFHDRLLMQANQHNVRVIHLPAEDDFTSIHGHVEIRDEKLAAEVRELTLDAGLKIPDPKILVPKPALQEDQRRRSGPKGEAECAEIQTHFGHGMRLTIFGHRLHPEGSTDLRPGIDQELAVR